MRNSLTRLAIIVYFATIPWALVLYEMGCNDESLACCEVALVAAVTGLTLSLWGQHDN